MYRTNLYDTCCFYGCSTAMGTRTAQSRLKTCWSKRNTAREMSCQSHAGCRFGAVVGCDSVRLERTGARPDFYARCCSRYVPSGEWNELFFGILGLIRDSNSRTHGLAPRRDGIHARLTRTGGRAPTRTIVRSTPRAHSALSAGQPHLDTRPHHSGRALHETPVANTHTRAHSTRGTWSLHSCTGIHAIPSRV